MAPPAKKHFPGEDSCGCPGCRTIKIFQAWAAATGRSQPCCHGWEKRTPVDTGRKGKGHNARDTTL
ncbi:MAG: hypothetical protein ACYDEZ_02820 [Methanoregula sp.]